MVPQLVQIYGIKPGQGAGVMGEKNTWLMYERMSILKSLGTSIS